jgi:DNA-binding transcriptional MocR family regulator
VRVESEVRAGRLTPGQRLPPVRALAAGVGLSPSTVAAAYRDLRRKGIVSAAGRAGTRIAGRPPLPVSPEPPPPNARDLANGNPDVDLLPSIGPALQRVDDRPHLYGDRADREDLLASFARELASDGIVAPALAVVSGALDGIERVLDAHVLPGDAVAVEDPGYSGVLDLVRALGLVPRPVAIDDEGMRPDGLERALHAGARAVVVTPRAQNPTGAALTPRRVRELRRMLRAHPDALVVEDDHAGPIAGVPALTLGGGDRSRWAVIRSVSKSLNPDLRLAVLAGDATTVARVEGRRLVGAGWVSGILQSVVANLRADPATRRVLARAERTYARRRTALVDALAGRGIAARGRSGLNVWVPVPEESRVVQGLLARGWAVRAGERYRIASPPAVRITTATLEPDDAAALAADLAAVLAPRHRRTSTA